MTVMSTEKYNRAARLLHWISAAVIIWASLAGILVGILDKHSVVRAWLAGFNVSLTTAFTPLFVLRAVNALRSGKPASLDVPRWQQRAAHFAHALLYALTSIALASGFLMMDHGIDVFGLFTLANPLSDPDWNGVFYGVHRVSCTALFLLVVVHVAAVVHHHRAGRPVLERMSLGNGAQNVTQVSHTCRPV
jgi:cytochrome b561